MSHTDERGIIDVFVPESGDLNANSPSCGSDVVPMEYGVRPTPELPSLPTLRHLRVFETVVRFQSVSAASRAMNLSQPAVSIAIASLERRLGIHLLERHHTGSLPSVYGEILLKRIRRMQELMTAAIQKFMGGTIDTESTLGKITTTHIRNLIAVSEHGSVGQAARSVGISESSLHRAIRDVEKLLGKPLFVSRPSGTSMTQQGAMLANRLNMALSEIRLAFEEIDTRKGIVNSRILVGLQSTPCGTYLAPAIDRLLATYPEVSIDVIEGPDSYLLGSLLAGKIDFLFGTLGSSEGIAEIHEEKLYPDNFVVVSAPDHPIRNVPRVERSQLAAHEWIISRPDTPRFRALQRLLGKHAKVRVVTDDRALTRALLIGSRRLSILAREEALAEQCLGCVEIGPFARKIVATGLSVAWRNSSLPTKTQQLFLKAVRDVFRDRLQSKS